MTIEEVKEHFKDAVMVRDLYGDEFDYTKISRDEHFIDKCIWVDCVDWANMKLYNNDTKELAEILTTKQTPTKPKIDPILTMEEIKVGDSVINVGKSIEFVVDSVYGSKLYDSNGYWSFIEDCELKTKQAPTKPKHYQTNTIDVIDFCSAYNLNFNRGNVVKYVCRAGRKDNELEDLEKALDYIKREIQTIKNK